MPSRDFRPDPFRVSLDDWRFRALLALSALLVGGLSLWAANEEVVEYVAVPIPERILRAIVVDDVHPAPDDPPSTGRGVANRPGGPARGPREGPSTPAWSPEGAVETPFSTLLSNPVFGSADVVMERWDEALANLDPTHPEGEVYLPPSLHPEDLLGGTRADGIVPFDPIAAMFDVPPAERTMFDLPDPGPRLAVVVSPPRLLERKSVVATDAVRGSARSWRKHAEACRTRVAPGWFGRVEVEVEVEAGVVSKVRIGPEREVPRELAACLHTRARHLLRFPKTETGGAKLPLIFE